MKKIIIFITLLLSSLFLFTQTAYAALSGPNDIAPSLTWQRVTIDGKYAIRTTRFQIGFADVAMEFNTTLSGWENFIVDTNGSTYSRVDIYQNQSFGSPLATYQITYEGPGATEILFLNDGNDNWNVNVSTHTNKWMQITLMLDPFAPISLINNVEHFMNEYRDQYEFRVNVRYQYNTFQTVADLPFTAGNPNQDNPGKMGTVYDYFYDGQNNTFYATIRYNQDYSIAIPNVDFGDDAFLDFVGNITYYSIIDQKFLQFDFVGKDDTIITLSNEYAKLWTGYAVWNLTTNELIVYNRALVLTYIDVMPNRDVFAYLYLPNIPIDDVISVSGFFNYRLGYKNILNQQKYHEWKESAFVLEKDEASYGSSSIFQGALPQWSYDVMKYASITNPIAAIFTMIPELKDVGFLLNYAGGFTQMVATAFTAYGGIAKVVTGKISDIETIQPDGILRNKLNTHYSEAADELIVLPTTVDIHKLYFGNFSSYQTNVVDVDASSLNYSWIVWVTKGQIYALDETLMDQKPILDPEDIAPPEDIRTPNDVFKDLLSDVGGFFKGLLRALFDSEVAIALRILIGVALAVGIFFIARAVSKFYKGAKKAVKDPGTLIIAGIVIVGIVIALGLIIF